MSDNFKALILNQEGENFTREVKSIEKSFLKHGDVLVQVDYSDLNYKDALILNNGAKLVKEFPHIPGIDFAGTVIESDNSKFVKGDEVILTGWRVGEIYFGGYSQLAKVNGDYLVKKPKDVTSKQAMILGTAGLTALLCSFAIKAREELLLGEKVKDVLVTGASGGVGSIAVMILNKFGYDVTAVTGKSENEEYLRTLGAKNIINKADLDKDPRPLDKGLWDGVVDTVGGKILANALAQTRDNGIVAACGNASDYKLNTTVMPFIIRGVKLWGINSVTASIKRREFVWNEVKNIIDFEQLEKSIKTISLVDLIDIYPKMLKGVGRFGRSKSILSIGLGCDAKYAKDFVYTENINVSDKTTEIPIGVSCRTCDRLDCSQRAFPPLHKKFDVDINSRGVSVYVNDKSS
jgi:alcohol dehydrogenase/acrylyl-CoA reductase (NADPH)